MSETLPTLNVAFPQVDPWFDLRPYLINGWQALGTQTFGMGVLHNSLMFSARLVADDATSWRIAEAIPWVGPQNMPISASLDGTPITVELQRSNGSLHFSAPYRQMPLTGELTISGVIPRGTEVMS